MERSKDAEKDIINAARKVFYEKGFKEATMRDIATEANINLAMVNYYFRSKENLFYIIYDETFMLLFKKLLTCIRKEDATIQEKIKNIISEYIDFFISNPHIPAFVIGEIIRNPQKIAARMKKNLNKSNIHKEFEEQIQNEINAGVIKPITVFSVYTNILSLIIFPIISQPIMKEAFNLNSSQFNEYMVNRKEEISNMIISLIEP